VKHQRRRLRRSEVIGLAAGLAVTGWVLVFAMRETGDPKTVAISAAATLCGVIVGFGIFRAFILRRFFLHNPESKQDGS